MLELNYELLIVFGVFPAIIIVGVTIMGIICFPYIAYSIYSINQEEMRRNNRTRDLISNLFKAPWSKRAFPHSEMCAICLVDFDENCLVTPLPCDIRHYYHAECIETWMLTRTCCPLCKEEVTFRGIEEMAS